MFKFILLFTFTLNNISLHDEFNTKVVNISYSNNDNYENGIILNIDLKSYARDVLELKIYFFDKNKNVINNNYFSSSLIINGTKSTVANIPFRVEDKTYFNIIVYSANYGNNIENLMFPVYPKEKSTCNFDNSEICISNYPTKVSYKNKKIEEEYEKINLINKNNIFFSFNNLIPLKNINIRFNGKLKGGPTHLVLKDKVDSFNLYYDNGYIFPLTATSNDELIEFEFSNRYYIDMTKGEVSENFLADSAFINQILLPYENKEYEMILEMEGCFSNFIYVKYSFFVKTQYRLIGDCGSSKYCVRKSYL